jgi:hypothetical protein
MAADRIVQVETRVPKDWAAVDMIAVRVMGPTKVAVVGAPAYFAQQRPPRAPDDLARHRCIQYRRAGAPCSSGHSSGTAVLVRDAMGG